MRRHRRHISLSLSLSTPDLAGKKPSFGADRGAFHQPLDYSRRGHGRGFCRSLAPVADASGVADQGQISKLLARLEGVGLLQNAGGHTQGISNAWRITPRGEEVLRAGSPNKRGAIPSFPEEMC